jgi:hypothetical protein
MRMIYNVEVEIRDMKVEGRYYSFYYVITSNGEVEEEGTYESDHVWSEKEMMEILRDGEALRLALEQMSN